LDEAEMREALEIARDYRGEASTRLGLVSRALLALAETNTLPERSPEGERAHGVVVARQTWLADTARIQREVFMLEPDSVQYAREQAWALVAEVVEAIAELPWKDQRDGLPEVTRNALSAVVGPEARARAQREVIDVAHFLANLAVAVGLDDREFWAEYNRKTCANIDKRRRQEHRERERWA
jgi:hypothetical protein